MPRRRYILGARLALLVALGAFAALQAGLAAYIERWAPELRDPFYGYKAKRLTQRLASQTSRPLTIAMLGSSRTTYGFRAGIVEEQLRNALGTPVIAFNFGIFGAGPVTELLTFRRMLAQGIRPDLVLIEVLPALLRSPGGVPLEAHWLPANRLTLEEIEFLGKYQFPVETLRSEWWSDRIAPGYAHRYALVSRVSPALLPNSLRQDWGRDDDPSGWSGASTPPASLAQYQKGVDRARLEYEENLKQFQLGGPACQALEDLLQLCRQEKVAAALVWMPEGTEYRQWYSSAVLETIEEYLQGLSRAGQCPVFDAREWIADADFADSHHLIERGANVFSDRFGRQALLPHLRGHKAFRVHRHPPEGATGEPPP